MPRRLSCASLVAAFALLGSFSASALATSTHATKGGGAGKSLAKPVKVKYTAIYTDEKFGPVECRGVHITSAQYPGTAISGGADKFKCKSTSKKPVLYGNPGEKLPENFTEWASDYFNPLGHFVLAKSLNVTLTGNGRAYKGFAVYFSPAEEAQKQKEKEEQELKEKEQKEKEEKEQKEKEEEEEPEV